jgi:hypothetical protein
MSKEMIKEVGMDSCGPEIGDILKAVKLYYDGHHYGDLEKLKKVFHPNCYVVGNFEGSLEYLLRDAYLDWIKEQETPASLGHPYAINVISIDVAGTAATVKVDDEYLGYRYTDYLSMIKMGEGWVIVNKAFNTEYSI